MSGSDWKVGFYAALAGFVHMQTGHEVVEVTGFDDSAYEQGGCPTCWGGMEYEVTVFYTKADDQGLRGDVYTFFGTFSDLLGRILG